MLIWESGEVVTVLRAGYGTVFRYVDPGIRLTGTFLLAVKENRDTCKLCTKRTHTQYTRHGAIYYPANS